MKQEHLKSISEMDMKINIHLCRFCDYSYESCLSQEIIYGTGIGVGRGKGPNVAACSTFYAKGALHDD